MYFFFVVSIDVCIFLFYKNQCSRFFNENNLTLMFVCLSNISMCFKWYIRWEINVKRVTLTGAKYEGFFSYISIILIGSSPKTNNKYSDDLNVFIQSSRRKQNVTDLFHHQNFVVGNGNFGSVKGNVQAPVAGLNFARRL